MKRIKYLLATVFSVAILSTGATTYAATDCSQNPAAPVCQIKDGSNDTTPAGGGARTPLTTRIATIVNILLFLIGLISVIVIIIAGIRYVTSGGDSAQVKGAKDTILYAVIGIIVALLAYAIVNFVVNQF